MEPIERLNLAISYIEKNLCADIDYNEISKITLSPIAAFQRFFFLTTGIALSEYIRRRRLSCSVKDLQSTDDKIIDIALKYGYDSPDAFSVAFKRTYNITPSAVRQENIKLEPFHRLYFELSIKYIKGDVMVNKITDLVANVREVEIFEMPELMLIGKEIRYGGKLGFLGNRAPELWDLCIEDGSLSVIRQLSSIIPNALIGWSGNYTSEDETFSYIVGAFVPLGTPVPRGYACRILPATYVAKGVYDAGYTTMIETYKSWGYTQNYDLFGWNGELYFKDDPSPTKWSQITPVKKII